MASLSNRSRGTSRIDGEIIPNGGETFFCLNVTCKKMVPEKMVMSYLDQHHTCSADV